MFVVVNALAQASDFLIERRQVVFLCWMQDSKLRSLRHQFASRLNTHSQTDWPIEDQAKNFNSTAHPYDEWAFSPFDFTADWLSYLALAIYMFVVVNFDALAQASYCRKETPWGLMTRRVIIWEHYHLFRWCLVASMTRQKTGFYFVLRRDI